MSRWLTLPGMSGDGEMVVGTERGTVKLPVVDGAILWPDELGAPHNAFKPASPSPRAHEVLRGIERDRLAAERAALDARLASLDEDAPAESQAPPPPSGDPTADALAALVRGTYGAARVQPQPEPADKPQRKRTPRGGKPGGRPRKK